jgi:hypothetical protein
VKPLFFFDIFVLRFSGVVVERRCVYILLCCCTLFLCVLCVSAKNGFGRPLGGAGRVFGIHCDKTIKTILIWFV